MLPLALLNLVVTGGRRCWRTHETQEELRC